MSDRYRITRGRIKRSKTRDPRFNDPTEESDGEAQIFEEGDVITPTEDELRAFGDKLSKLPNQDSVEPDADDEFIAPEMDDPDELDDTPDEYFGDLENKNVNEVRTYLAENDFSDDELDMLAEEERYGKDRKTVYKELDMRRGE